MTIEANGIIIAIFELSLFAGVAYPSRKYIKSFKNIEVISYYWLAFTILTGIWEVCFIYNYHSINDTSQKLITNGEHVWTNKYTLDYVLPWKLARIFYAEYGAHGDREYLLLNGDWSKVVESSHAIFCGLFSLFTLLLKMAGNSASFNICLGISMGSQFMNSLLYMVNYWYQCYDKENVNYITSEFPAGHWFLKRAFMYINVFWLIFPAYTITYYLLFNNFNHNLNKNTVEKLKNNNDNDNDEKEPLITKSKSDSGLFKCCY